MPVERRLGDDPLAAREQCVDRGVLLVGVDVPRQDVLELTRVVRPDPLAGGERRLARHVLTRSITRGVVAAKEADGADGVRVMWVSRPVRVVASAADRI